MERVSLLLLERWNEIREKERAKILGEVAWRVIPRGTPLNSLSYVSYQLSDQQETTLNAVSTDTITVSRVGSWRDYGERDIYVTGGLVAILASKKGPAGIVSFDILSNNQAIISQIQGVKNRPFDTSSADAVVGTVSKYLQSIGTERVYMITGSIINSTRQHPIPDLVEKYRGFAVRNGFTQDLYGLPYKDLQTLS